MNKVTYKVVKHDDTYKVVEHDGGWAHEANGRYCGTFRTREQARTTARLATSAPATPREGVRISSEDEKGRGHNDVGGGTDRPNIAVEG